MKKLLVGLSVLVPGVLVCWAIPAAIGNLIMWAAGDPLTGLGDRMAFGWIVGVIPILILGLAYNIGDDISKF